MSEYTSKCLLNNAVLNVYPFNYDTGLTPSTFSTILGLLSVYYYSTDDTESVIKIPI